MTPLIAVPFVPHAVKIETILDALCIHRPWFPDDLWNDPVIRRRAASQRLAEVMVSGLIWEVWRGDELVGILLLDRITKYEAYCHFVFLDRRLSDKVDLCRSLMAWCFTAMHLHILRVEIPTYARVLARFARKRLGFRYEAEGRQLSWPPGPGLTAKQAELGSRKYHGQYYEGCWNDLLLLSLTKEEFDGTNRHPPERQHGPDSGPQTADLGLPPGDPPGPPGDAPTSGV